MIHSTASNTKASRCFDIVLLRLRTTRYFTSNLERIGRFEVALDIDRPGTDDLNEPRRVVNRLGPVNTPRLPYENCIRHQLRTLLYFRFTVPFSACRLRARKPHYGNGQSFYKGYSVQFTMILIFLCTSEQSVCVKFETRNYVTCLK